MTSHLEVDGDGGDFGQIDGHYSLAWMDGQQICDRKRLKGALILADFHLASPFWSALTAGTEFSKVVEIKGDNQKSIVEVHISSALNIAVVIVLTKVKSQNLSSTLFELLWVHFLEAGSVIVALDSLPLASYVGPRKKDISCNGRLRVLSTYPIDINVPDLELGNVIDGLSSYFANACGVRKQKFASFIAVREAVATQNAALAYGFGWTYVEKLLDIEGLVNPKAVNYLGLRTDPFISMTENLYT
jgi:hypothetical protein